MRCAPLLLVAVAAACGDSTEPDTEPVETDQVTIVDNAFEPPDIIIAEGQTVTWTWTGFQQHTVIFDDPSFPRSPLQTLGTHQVTFTLAGTFPYFCSVHGRAVMSGTVQVREQAPQP